MKWNWLNWFIAIVYLIIGIGECVWAAKGVSITTLSWGEVICRDFLITLLAFDLALTELKDKN